MKKFLILIVLMVWSQVSLAQEAALEEVVVTGTRSSEYDGEESPAVKLIKKADSILLEVRIFNDSRKKEMRASEMQQTLKRMIELSGKYKNIMLGYGGETFHALNLKNYKDLPLRATGRKIDTNYVDVFVKTPIQKNKNNSQKLIDDIKKFIKGISVVGRSELINDDEPILTIINPQKYRYEVIQKIAEDTKNVTASFGSDYRVVVKGLSNPLFWERASIDEMALFIPNSYHVVPLNSYGLVPVNNTQEE